MARAANGHQIGWLQIFTSQFLPQRGWERALEMSSKTWAQWQLGWRLHLRDSWEGIAERSIGGN